MIRLLPALVALTLAACTHSEIKDVEDQVYDFVAQAFSNACQGSADSELVRRDWVEVAREIRQRGSNGPTGPNPIPDGLDEKTALGLGPVVVVRCAGDTVEQPVWLELRRNWR